jgi:predicted phage terminase large subunit-like protein
VDNFEQFWSGADLSLQAALQTPELGLKELTKLDCEMSLAEFVRTFWHELEPISRRLVWGWHLDAICDHLEAVTNGEVSRLLINVPPGGMKSMLVSVFWPAWEWGPRNMPYLRYISASYSQHLSVRDNQRFLRVITSPLYQELWGERFSVDREGQEQVMNNQTGWKLATSVGGVGTGERGDRVLIDDPHNVKEGESELKRLEALNWFTEVMPLRVNDPEKSAFVVIMQRVHEDDISGKIITEDHGYVHLMIPMEYDPGRHCETAYFSDPRFDPEREDKGEGDLYWPERFPRNVVERDKFMMGPYAVAAQFQQSPAPRGGGIIKRDWWKLWPPEGEKFHPDGRPLRENEFPPMSFILASVDTAMTEKTQNDESAISVWGCWQDKYGLPKLMLLFAWSGRVEFHELTEKVIEICLKRKVDALLIEAKNNGISLAQEVKRRQRDQQWATHLIEPRGDKVARLYSVQNLYSTGMIFAPDRSWADKVITQCEVFPKGKHDDLVDTASQALLYLRQTGMAVMRDEDQIEKQRAIMFKPQSQQAMPYDI